VSSALSTAIILGAIGFILIPLMVWTVMRAKRKAAGFAIAYSLFFGFERIGEHATDATQQAQDPEGLKQPGSGAPLK
jgi:hypothetical protein